MHDRKKEIEGYFTTRFMYNIHSLREKIYEYRIDRVAGFVRSRKTGDSFAASRRGLNLRCPQGQRVTRAFHKVRCAIRICQGWLWQRHAGVRVVSLTLERL